MMILRGLKTALTACGLSVMGLNIVFGAESLSPLPASPSDSSFRLCVACPGNAAVIINGQPTKSSERIREYRLALPDDGEIHPLRIVVLKGTDEVLWEGPIYAKAGGAQTIVVAQKRPSETGSDRVAAAAKHDRVIEKLEELQSSVDELMPANLKKRAKQLKADEDAFKARKEKLDKDIETLAAREKGIAAREREADRRDQMQVDRDQLQTRRESLQTERDQLQQRRDKLQGERDTLQSQRETQFTADQKSIADLKAAVTKQQVDTNKLQDERDKLQRERDDLQQRRDKLQNERDTLQQARDKH